MKTALSEKNNSKTIFDLAAVMFVFAFALRLVIAIGYVNKYDTMWYREWALSLPDGLFDVYSRAEEISLDYPPVLLFFLYITGWAYRAVGDSWHIFTDMLFMKFWPVVFDILCGVVLFYIFKRKNIKMAFVASALWLFNPSTIFNSSFWGQTDGMMCLVLLISFSLLENNRPILSCVMFAIAGLTKFQCLFFLPLFLTELFLRTNLKTFFKGILSAAATAIGVFLPFMIGAKNLFLFFDVYLGGQDKYQKCTLNAFNFYGMLGLNWVEDSEVFFGGITYNMFGNIMTVLILLAFFALYIFAKNKNFWVIGFLLMNSLFMFMSRMHERYQFVVLIFILMAAFKTKKRGFFYCFVLTSIMTLFNQLIPMYNWNSDGSLINNYYGSILIVMSAVNFAVYIITSVFCVTYLNNDNNGQKKEKPKGAEV